MKISNLSCIFKNVLLPAKQVEGPLPFSFSPTVCFRLVSILLLAFMNSNYVYTLRML